MYLITSEKQEKMFNNMGRCMWLIPKEIGGGGVRKTGDMHKNRKYYSEKQELFQKIWENYPQKIKEFFL